MTGRPKEVLVSIKEPKGDTTYETATPGRDLSQKGDNRSDAVGPRVAPWRA